MPLNRRRFIATVATGSVAAQLPAKLTAADSPVASPPAPTIATPASIAAASNADTLAAAEKLAGISFTPAQREPIVKTVTDRAAGYSALRTPAIPNSVFPAVTFEPRLAGVRIPSATATTSSRLGATWQPAKFTRPASDEDLAFLPLA